MSQVSERHAAALDDDDAALVDACAQVLAFCRQAGADQCQVRVDRRDGLEAGVRNGEVETVSYRRDEQLQVTALIGGRIGRASSGDLSAASLLAMAGHACAIARHTGADPCNGLADPALQARAFRDLDQWHPWVLDADAGIALALAADTAGLRHDRRIGQSKGAQLESLAQRSVLADSQGFLGRHRRTRHELSAAFTARDAAGLQGGDWYDLACRPTDLQAPETIGRLAAERTLARLGARPLSTRQCPVLFAPEVASGLFGHLLSALDGGAVHRGSSFLAGQLDEPLLPGWVDVRERPHLPRSPGGRVFDDEGVATAASPVVDAGRIRRYLLDSYAARRLGMTSTGNAGGYSQIEVAGRIEAPADMLAALDTGLLVTGVMGQGVSLVTGDYSRGASGFWVERGRIVHPVEEVTIASHLREMFGGIQAIGEDRDHRQRIGCGSVLVGRMTVAGR